jgi:PleD family two-component response regulator
VTGNADGKTRWSVHNTVSNCVTFSEKRMMPNRAKAIAFDVDPDSLASLRQAFPEWEIEATNRASTGSLIRDWNPESADLLVVGARDQVAETLGLCRELRSQAGRAHTPLLLLVPLAQEPLVRAALDVGVTSCLVLPVHAKDLVRMVTRARVGSQPGRHTLGLDRAQSEDWWRDEGGEA